jgi:hypothetical protein
MSLKAALTVIITLLTLWLFPKLVSIAIVAILAWMLFSVARARTITTFKYYDFTEDQARIAKEYAYFFRRPSAALALAVYASGLKLFTVFWVGYLWYRGMWWFMICPLVALRICAIVRWVCDPISSTSRYVKMHARSIDGCRWKQKLKILESVKAKLYGNWPLWIDTGIDFGHLDIGIKHGCLEGQGARDDLERIDEEENDKEAEEANPDREAAVARLVDFGILQNGKNGFEGRNAAVSVTRTYEELFTAQALETADPGALKMRKGAILGNDMFERTSEGYVYATVKAFLASGSGDSVNRIRTLMNAWESSDIGWYRLNNSTLKLTRSQHTAYQAMLHVGPEKWGDIKDALTERQYKILREKDVYFKMSKMVKDALQIMLDHNGDETLGFEFLTQNLHSNSIKYAQFLEEFFTEMQQTFAVSAAFQGWDRDRIMNLSKVPLRWRSFGREYSNTAEKIGSTKDAIALERSLFVKVPSRPIVGDSVEVISINGIHSPMEIVSDMTYRMFVSPAYDTFIALFGETQVIDGAIAFNAENPGYYHAARSYPDNAEKQELLERACAVISNMGQTIITNDLNNNSGANRLLGALRNITFFGEGIAVASRSQFWGQTFWQLLAYLFVGDRVFKYSDN